MRTEGRIDTTNLIFAFLNFANGPKGRYENCLKMVENIVKIACHIKFDCKADVYLKMSSTFSGICPCVY